MVAWKLAVAIVVSSLLLAPEGLTAGPCEGKKPIPHDDGTYSFSHESWERKEFGTVYYGRCIKVIDPTEKMRAHWVGALPPGIARTNRPIRGGQDFLTKDNEDRMTPLYYGNADAFVMANYIAHRNEPQVDPTPFAEMKVRDLWSNATFKQVMAKNGSFSVHSDASFSFYYDEKNDNSLMDLDLWFNSHYDGKIFSYVLDYKLKPVSDVYEPGKLFISFQNKALSNVLNREKDIDNIAVVVGEDTVKFKDQEPGNIDFVAGNMVLVRETGKSLDLPISFLLRNEF